MAVRARIAWLVLTSLLALSTVEVTAAAERLVRTGTLQIPGIDAKHVFDDFDLSFVDSKLDLYLLSDISNKAVDVFRASSGEFLFRVGGFFGHVPPGYAHVGPTGVITAAGAIWAADAPSTVKIIDLSSHRVVEQISTGGEARADTLSYDERDEIVLVTNPDDPTRFVTLISAKPGHRVLGKITFPHATGDLEASAWWAATGYFYLLIAEVDGDPRRGAVAVIDPVAKAVVATFAVPDCRPTGIAIGSQNEALLGCLGEGLGKTYGFPDQTLMIDLKSGTVSQRIKGVTGSDQVWFNPGDNHYYVAAEAARNGPVLAAIRADGSHAVLTASTQARAHTVSADSRSNRVFVPFGPSPADPRCRYGCVAIFGITEVER